MGFDMLSEKSKCPQIMNDYITCKVVMKLWSSYQQQLIPKFPPLSYLHISPRYCSCKSNKQFLQLDSYRNLGTREIFLSKAQIIQKVRNSPNFSFQYLQVINLVKKLQRKKKRCICPLIEFEIIL